MKKKLLFVNESLTLAGGEKSLIALLSNLNSDKYDIDIQLFKFGGALDDFIPEYVNVLPPLAYTQYTGKSWKNNLLSFLKGENTQMFFSKLSYSLFLRCRKRNHNEKAMLFWKCTKKSFSIQTKQYDVAIAYAQGIPTFYTMDKVKSKKKIAWINVVLNFPPATKKYNYNFYKQYDSIVSVSSINKQQFKELYPDFSSRLNLIYDIIDYKSMTKMSELKNQEFNKDTFNILTVARLNKNQKGYDITLRACRILRDKGIDFHWYAVGTGDYRSEMEKYIKENQLENCFTFLGTTANPYPYFKAADLYVQTSRLEGFGISIAEARLLNLPVVTTRYDSVDVQMIHEKNGLITDLNPESVAEGIIRMMEDKKLYQSIKEYLKTEPKENLESVKKFDEMIESLG